MLEHMIRHFKYLIFIIILVIPSILLSEGTYYYSETIGGGAAPTDYTADANCMGAWYMNNNGGDETDRSGKGETLTQNGGTIPTDAGHPTSYSGTSRDFEASESETLYHADGGSTDINGADQAMSFCAWIKFEADPGADATIVNKYSTIGDNRQYKFRHDHSSNAMYLLMSGDGQDPAIIAIGTTDLADDTDWHHVCFVYNDTDMRIYVDGSLDSNGADNPKTYSAGIYNGSKEFSLGAEDSDGCCPTSVFDGLMDEVIIFNRALSAAEVSDIMTNGIDGTNGGTD